MTTITFGGVAIIIPPTAYHTLLPGDRVCYVPPDGKATRVTVGTLQAISGASALVRWDALGWVGGAPLERLTLETQRPDGWTQLSLV